MAIKIKKYETIGCCGIDCGLCPRYHTKGSSVCPGCGGLDFTEKHPSCGFLTCCAIKRGHEVCSECSDYPCKRFDGEKDGLDSFVSHKKIFGNLDGIKDYGILNYIENQKIRIEILKKLISDYDDGRSKSFYCICCTLLPIAALKEAMVYGQKIDQNTTLKEKSKMIKDTLKKIAVSMGVELKLNK